MDFAPDRKRASGRRASAIGSATNPPSPITEAANFVRGPAMFCPFGTLADRHGRLKTIAIPSLLQPDGTPLAWQSGYLPALRDEEKIQCSVQEGLRTLHGKRADAVLFIEKEPAGNHQEGMLRAWALWAELVVAGLVLHGDKTSPLLLRSRAVETASRGARPENIDDFSQRSNIHLGDQQYVLTAINPCYGTEGGSKPGVLHPRYFPVSAYLVTPFTELVRVRDEHSRPAVELARRIVSDAKYPYLAGLPYVIPNDPRFLIPEFRELIGAAERLQRVDPQRLKGEPLEIARATYIYLQDKMLKRADGAQALQRGEAFDPMTVWSEMGLLNG